MYITDSFTCPQCGIEQHDVYITDGYLFLKDEEPCTVYRCNSCGERLLEDEVGSFHYLIESAAINRQARQEDIRGARIMANLYAALFWISFFFWMRCWLS